MRHALPALLLAWAAPAAALTELLYDTEPNDRPHEAVSLTLPTGKDSLRIIGELEGQDQDAYRIVVDEDLAGRTFDVQLNGRGGALTKLDVFDFTELADGRGRIPAELTARPTNLLTLRTTDGVIPARVDELLFAPGVYVLGVSHSGGSGAYTVEISERDDARIQVIGDDNARDNAQKASTRGRTTVFTQGETWFDFELNEKEAGQGWNLDFQTPLGRKAALQLLDGAGNELLAMASSGGVPVRRAGLSLAAGQYRLKTDQKTAGVQMVTLEAGAPPPRDGREVEPNDREPTLIEPGQALAGRLEGNDTDWLAFDVTADHVGRLYDLVLSTDADSKVQVCLTRPAIRLSHCVRGGGGSTALRGLGFSEGRYQLRMKDGDKTGTDWQLAWTERGPAKAGEEVEPNNSHEYATALHERGFGRGHFDGRETDHWRFSVTGEPQLWRLQIQGENLGQLSLKNSAGKVIADQRAHNNRRVRLDNAFLVAGDYVLAAQGQDSDYILRLQPLGPPPPGMELEPNDDVADAERLRFGVEHFGTLTERGDIDRYAFTLHGHERVRITLRPPADGAIRAELGGGDEAQTISHINNPEPGEPVYWERYLPPADYSIKLDPKQESDAEYTLVMERLDYLAPVATADREPNDARIFAVPLPAGGQVDGAVGMTRAGEDWYALPVQDAPATIELPEHDGIRLTLFAESQPTKNQLVRDGGAGVYRGELAPGEKHWLQIRGRGEYAFDLSGLAEPAPAGLPLEVTLASDHDRFRAYSPWAQRLTAEATVTNPGNQSRRVAFASHATDSRWRLEHEAGPFELAAGASRTVPIGLYVPWDMPAANPVQLSVRASDGDGGGSATVAITADAEVTPVDPVFHWPVPEALRGGFNAAAVAFGAEPVAGPNMDKNQLADSASLFDGRIRVGATEGFQLRVHRGEPEKQAQPTVRLAGDEPVPVAGFLLHPVEGRFTPRGSVRDFAVALSLDGETFQTVLEGRLDPVAEEQVFDLDEPVPARYARLIPKAPHFASSGANSMGLGEFKVVAEPGWRPPGEPFNLAAPELGGHQVWAEPWIRGSGFNQNLLTADGKSAKMNLSGAPTATVVLGFHHARMALVDAVAFLPRADARPESQPLSVNVAVAADSPLGPWEPVTGGELASGETRLDFDAPAWARYVRFRFEAPEGARWLAPPDRISVYESRGPSILGEWGHYTDIGPFEAQDVPEWEGLAGEPANTSRDTAMVLGAEPAPGSALLDDWSSWYRVPVPAGNNHLVLRLKGTPSLEAKPRLTDGSGGEVALYPIEQSVSEHAWEAYVEPGRDYWVEVFEPPRSVIFSWDTSASVGRYLPTIANALRTYAATVKPGRDEVNLLPFGRRSPLLKNWEGNAYPLMRMLSAYPHDTSSSSAEQTLAVAAREMIGRPGKKAVLLLTDAATTTNAGLWPALHEGQPQVFAMKLSSVGAFTGDPVLEIDLMQDWARVRGGHFSYVTGFGDLSHGFERAVSRLKGPVDFSIRADVDQVADPTPATVAVVSGETGADPGARGAVEVILDASGSMLKRMDGTPRINIAKDAIRRTVEETLPEGIPLALRVYGHREAGSCRTDLEIPLAPLDRKAFLQKLEGIQAVNLAKTPIAESLAAVAADLADAEGRRLVVLLTDGEETCEGDPAAEIEKLQDSGFDVRVNIVGFAIDDEDLKRQFAEWAEIGGGQYLDAGEAAGLGDALQKALQVPFTVVDANGEEVAQGLVDGETVEIPAGRYSLRVEVDPPQTFRDVSLAPGDERVIEME